MGNNYKSSRIKGNLSRLIKCVLIVFTLSFATQNSYSQSALMVVNVEAPDGADTAGDILNYTVTVRNTGGVDIINPTLGSNASPTITLTSIETGTLVAGATRVYNATYALTMPDVATSNTNGVVNTFTFDGDNISPINYVHTEIKHEDDYSSATIIACLKIEAIDDDFTSTPINGSAVGSPGNVLNNDKLNNITATVSLVTPTMTDDGGSGATLNSATGEISVPAGTTSGTYTISYTICENDTPGGSPTGNCDSATAMFLVAAPTVVIGGDLTDPNSGNITVTEGESPNAIIPITLSNPSAETITVTITIPATGSANETEDYTSPTGTSATATINPGQTTVTLLIPIEDDTVYEQTESFTVNGLVSGNVNNTSTSGVVTILDNDTAPTVVIGGDPTDPNSGNITVTEGESPNAIIPITLSNPSAETITVTITIPATGSANETEDYTSPTGTSATATINPGQTTVTLLIPIEDDTVYEQTESFTVNGLVSGNVNNTSTSGVVTILDNDTTPTVVIGGDPTDPNSGNITVTEGESPNAIIPITLSNPSAETITVTITIPATGSANETEDYTSPTGTSATATINPGQTTVTLLIPIEDDTVYEQTESFTVNGLVSGNVNNTSTSGVVTILDNDTAPTVVIGGDPTDPNSGNITVTEGESPNAIIPITLSNPSAETITVTITIPATGSANETEDYTSPTGTSATATINPGQTTVTLLIPIEDDTVYEQTESFTVNGLVSGNVNNTSTSGVVTILDNDTTPTVVIGGDPTDPNSGNITVTEGESPNAIIPITLSNPSAETITVTITIPATGSANETEDYTSPTGTSATATINPGQTTVTLLIPIEDDTVYEQTESFTVNGLVSGNVNNTSTSGVVTILDNDTAPTVVIGGDPTDPNSGNITVTEGESPNAIIPITLSNPSAETITVTITIPATGSANETEDYTSPTGTSATATINPGQTTVTLLIPIEDDTVYEQTESFTVNGLVSGNVNNTSTSGVVTILDNDTAPTVVIGGDPTDPNSGNITVTEGESPNAIIPITLSNPSAETITVTITIPATGSANETEDYTSPTGTSATATINPGQTTVTLLIPIEDDTVYEQTESFTVNGLVSGNVNNTSTSGVVTILDNDTTPTVVIGGDPTDPNSGNITVTEGESPNAIIPITLSNPSAETITVTITIPATGSANETEDYTSPTGTSATATINPGQTTVTLLIPIEDDTVYEQTESFTVNGLVSGNVNNTSTSGVVTILDNDTAPTVVIGGDPTDPNSGNITVTEGESPNAIIPITLSNPSAETITVTITIPATGSANETEDYTSPTGTSAIATINPGQTTVTLLIPIEDDTVYEQTESFTVNGLVSGNVNNTSTSGVVTILDNDTAPTVVIGGDPTDPNSGNITVTEGESPNAIIPITLSNPSAETITVTITIPATGSANETEDYTSPTGTSATATINPGQTTVTLLIPIEDDTVYEQTESFTVNGLVSGNVNNTSTSGVVTILDNDTTPTVVIGGDPTDPNSGNITVTEGESPNAIIPITLSNPSAETITVTITIPATGSANETEDYTSPTGTSATATINPGQTTVTLLIPIEDDTVYEQTESFTVNGLVSGNVNNTSTSGVVTILDNDTTPTVVIGGDPTDPNSGNITVTEGESPNAIIPITLSNPSAETITVTITIPATGSANETEDYTSPTGTSAIATINPGQTTVTLLIPIEDDTVYEQTESFTVNGLVSGNVNNTSTSGVVTILDNDTAPTVVIGGDPTDPNSGNITVTEGESPNAIIPITLSNPSAETITVTITIPATGSANETEDYTSPTGTSATATINPGQTTVTLLIPIEDDTVYEQTESFTVNGLVSGNVNNTSTSGVVTILDNDTAPTVVIGGDPTDPNSGNITVTEGESPNAIIPITLSNPSAETITVTITIPATGSANETEDYTSPTGTSATATINPGQTTVTLLIPIEDDTVYEQTESFTVNGLVSGNVNNTSTSGVVTILDNDTTPTVVIGGDPTDPNSGNITVTEGESPNAIIPITLSNPSAETITVTITIPATGSANETEDYTSPTGTSATATINPGQTTVTLLIPIEDDTVYEQTESFTVNGLVSGNVNNTSTSGVVTILDNDTTPTVVIGGDPTDPNSGNITVTEGESPNAIIPITLSNPSAETITVTITIPATGSANETEDYTSPTGTSATATINPGQTKVTLLIPIEDDTVYEQTESFTVNGLVSGNVNNTSTSGVVTILDNDTAPTVVIGGDPTDPNSGNITVTEGESPNAIIPITLSNPSAETITVTITIPATGSANETEDYTFPTSGTATINPGQTTVTLLIPIEDDTVYEQTESFTVNGLVSGNVNNTSTSGVVTILDNDTTPTVVIGGDPTDPNSGNITVTEGESPNAIIPITLSNPSAETITVTITIPATGSANETEDYTSPTGTSATATINPGQTTVTLLIPIEDDTVYEQTESFTVNGLVSGNVNNTSTPGVVTILDNDTTPTVVIGGDPTDPNSGNITVTEGESSNAIIPITLSNPSAETITVTITIPATGSANETEDYTFPTSGTATINPGQTTVTLLIPIEDDTVYEQTESFTVNGLVSGNVNNTSTSGVVTILDNDTTPTVVIGGDPTDPNSGNITVTEGESPNAIIPITLSNPSAETITVTITIPATGSANETEDYTSPTGTSATATINPGQTTVTLLIPIEDDTVYEQTESFTVNGLVSGNVNNTSTSGVVTILDNDTTPTVVIGGDPTDPNSGNITVTEGESPNAIIPITLSNPSAETITVTITIPATGSANETEDYTFPTSGTATINPGQTTVTLLIPIEDDTVYEQTESFTVNGLVSGNVNNTSTSGVVTILDNDTTPTVVIGGDPTDPNSGNITVTEGESPNAIIPITLSNPSAETITVTITIPATGSANETEDYTSPTGTSATATINPGQTTVTLLIPIEDDTVYEQTESFTVNGLVSGNVNNTSTSGVVTILDNDTAPTVVIGGDPTDPNSGNITVTEGESPNAIIPITLSNPSAETITVTITIPATGSANETEDYTSPTGTSATATINPGQTTVTLLIPIEDDTVYEQTESFTVNGLVSGNVNNTSTSGVVTILDNDTAPTVVIGGDPTDPNSGNITVTEGESPNAIIPITLSNPSAETITVTITIPATGSANETEDYTSPTGTSATATINPGQTTVTLLIPIEDDTVYEQTESFTVNGLVSGNVNNTSTSGVVTILDNDTTPTVVIGGDPTDPNSGNITVTEGESPNAIIPITLSNPSAETITVTITIPATGSANETEDYTSPTGTSATATINPGQTTVTLLIPIEDDTVYEQTESFTVNGLVSGNVNNTSTPGVVTILDNDTTPTVVIGGDPTDPNSGNITVTEGESPNAIIPITLSNPSAETITVTITIPATGSANETEDYTFPTSGTATINPGQTTVTLLIPIEDDTVYEQTESFTVNGLVSGNVNNTSTSGVVTILDNDDSEISIDPVTVDEGETAMVVVSIDVPSSATTVIVITTTSGTAGTDDYITTNVTVTIPAGETSVIVPIGTVNDGIDEPDEEFTVNAVVTSGNTSNTSTTGTVIITDNDIPVDLSITKTVDDEAPRANEEVMFTITVTNPSEMDATGVIVQENIPDGYEYISSTASAGSYDNPGADGVWNVGTVPAKSSVTLLITVKVNEYGDFTNTVTMTSSITDPDSTNNEASATAEVVCLTVYNEFSPNGDGINEYLIIDCLDNYIGNKLSIFNRWGRTVYTATNYDNSWNGVSNGTSLIHKGEKLPTGAYYYVLELGNDAPVKKGWIYIVTD